MNYEDITEKLGDFGKYQKRLSALILLPIVFGAFSSPLSVFIQAEQEYRCQIPGLYNDTYVIQNDYHQDLVNQTIPITANGKYDKCSIKRNNTTQSCSEWVYDISEFTLTVNSQFNLVCDDEWLQAHAILGYILGAMVSTFTIIPFGDVIGRRLMLCIAIILRIICNIAMPFSPTYLFFVACRVLDGYSGLAFYQGSFILGLELISKSKRMVIGTLVALVYCAGEMILVFVAYFIRDWRYIQLTVALPMIIPIIYLWERIFPESPRWLISRGRQDKALKIIKYVAKVNKVKLPDNLTTLYATETVDEGILKILKQLLCSRRMVLRWAIVAANWFTISFIYFALTINIGKFGGNLFLNFTIAVIMEAVGYTLCFFLNLIGRRKLHLAVMFTAGIACLGSIFPILYGDISINWITIALSMVGKLGISAAYGAIYIYTGELFPTVVRSGVMASCSLFARCGSSLAPYMYRLTDGEMKNVLPLIVYGVLTIVVALLSLYLPETNGKRLLEKVKDVDNLDNTNINQEEMVRLKQGEISGSVIENDQNTAKLTFKNIASKARPI